MIRLRLFPEYYDGVPVFPRSDDTDALIPEALQVELVAWNDYFNQNYHFQHGWRSEETKRKWTEDAAPLAAELQEALAGKVELEIDLWPEGAPPIMERP